MAHIRLADSQACVIAALNYSDMFFQKLNFIHFVIETENILTERFNDLIKKL